ncbi:hypothetical protein EJB05_57694, partial [Eragrostis curvula]
EVYSFRTNIVNVNEFHLLVSCESSLQPMDGSSKNEMLADWSFLHRPLRHSNPNGITEGRWSIRCLRTV